MNIADAEEFFREKSAELDTATDVLTEEIRALNHRLALTNTTTTVWLMTTGTETDPDLPSATLAWMVGYAHVRSSKDATDTDRTRGKRDQGGRVWCLCAKRVRVDLYGNPVEVVRTCTLDSAPRHVRAAAVHVLPKLIKDLREKVTLHADNVVHAAALMKAFNAGKVS